MPCATKFCFRVLLRLVALRRCGSVRVLLRFFDRVLQLLQTSGRVPLLLFFMFSFVFLLLFAFPSSLPRPLSPPSLDRVPLRLQRKLEQCAASSALQCCVNAMPAPA